MTIKALTDDELLLISIYNELPEDDRKLIRLTLVRLQQGYLSQRSLQTVVKQYNIPDAAAA